MSTASPTGNGHLVDITEVHPFSSDNQDDVQCFEEIRQTLKKYNFLNRFGVCLLHKHFEILPDEKLVESCDELTRTLTIKPVKEQYLQSSGSMIETSWSLDPKKPVPQVSCETYCWKDNKGEHQWSHKKE